MESPNTMKLKFSEIKLSKNIFLTCILLSLLILFSGCSQDVDLRMFKTYASYDLSIQTNETITNVTFLIPLPVKGGAPIVGQRVLQEGDFLKNGFKAILVKDPSGSNIIDETTQILRENLWYVKISADQIIPQQSTNWQYEIIIFNASSISDPSNFIDTRYPIGNVSLILPKVGFTQASPTIGQSNSPYTIKYEEVRIPHFTELYADYSASPSAKVQIVFNLKQGNWWKELSDSSNGNSCSEYITWDHIGEANGWYQARDILYAAQGVYPNLSSPEWQKVIEQNSTGK